MENLFISLILMAIVLGLIKRYLPLPYGVIKKLFLSGLKGWAGFLWKQTERSGGTKVQPPRIRYRR